MMSAYRAWFRTWSFMTSGDWFVLTLVWFMDIHTLNVRRVPGGVGGTWRNNSLFLVSLIPLKPTHDLAVSAQSSYQAERIFSFTKRQGV